MRVALVHDWLYIRGGAERVLEGILRSFPQADVHCLFDILSEEDREKIGYKTSKTTFIQRMPNLRKLHRSYLPLMPMAIEQLDLSQYDVVISSSHAVAKGVITGPDQLHISYVHSPMRYAWDLQHQYLRESNMQRGLKSMIARTFLHQMRIWDVRTANGVDEYIANSRFVARRIQKLYGRRSAVINPPVLVPDALGREEKQNFFLTASRLVPYKNTRVIIEAFATLPDQYLLVAGTGPELARLKEIAPPNVTFLGFVEDQHLHHLMAQARAFVFAAEEDFGIVVVEAQGRGTPVIALGRGGAVETVEVDGTEPTGMFFSHATPTSIAEAVRGFIDREADFTPENCHRNALRFANDRFDEAFSEFVHRRYEAFRNEISGRAWRPVAVPRATAPSPIRSAAIR
jgi:glycosyltransferase involved in cell wall biosynthesis